jgi:hypothetical protein
MVFFPFSPLGAYFKLDQKHLSRRWCSKIFEDRKESQALNALGFNSSINRSLAKQLEQQAS